MKRIYLDVCTLCRPFDDQSAMRVRLETDAFFLILQSLQDGKYEMLVSPAHIVELDSIRDVSERIEIKTLLDKYGTKPSCDLQTARSRAEELVVLKFGVADASHIALAEATADFFLSCDDKLLKKCRKNKVKIQTMNPVEFCVMENLR